MKEALLYSKEKISGKELIRCKLCAHYCLISEGKTGICTARLNKNGKLYTYSYGKTTGLAMDPIEKKPFFHFKPGAQVLSFGTFGCNFRCLGCQNFATSQQNLQSMMNSLLQETFPKEIAEEAFRQDADGIAYTYNEPTIFFEYARDTILEARKIDNDRKTPKEKRKFNVFVTNGYFTEEMWKLVEKEKLLDAVRIDLKSMSDKFYREYCKATLEPVLQSIKRVGKSKTHIEVIALLVPKMNDSKNEIRELANFVASVGKDIPLHFLRFFPNYNAGNIPATERETLINARKIALDEGLKYVYVGNMPEIGAENTYCPKCKALLIERTGYGITKNVFSEEKKPFCPECKTKIKIVL